MVGSILAARHAGTAHAARATTSSVATTQQYVSGSRGDTPNKSSEITGPAAAAAIKRHTTPAPAPRGKNPAHTPRRCQPEAIADDGGDNHSPGGTEDRSDADLAAALC